MPRNESNNKPYEPTSDRSTHCGSGHLIQVFRDIGHIFSLLHPSLALFLSRFAAAQGFVALRQTFVRRCHGVGAWTCLLLSNALPGNCSDPGGAPRNGRARTAGTSELGGELTYQRFSCSGVMAARQPRNSPACKGKSLRCLRKCRFAYIDTSPALSARRHLTAALRPSRSHLGCQTHQTYCFRTFSEPPRLPLVACCAQQVQNFDLSQRFWCRGLWGVGFNEQIFGADEQNLGRGQSD